MRDTPEEPSRVIPALEAQITKWLCAKFKTAETCASMLSDGVIIIMTQAQYVMVISSKFPKMRLQNLVKVQIAWNFQN